jgi:hypothetical protein
MIKTPRSNLTGTHAVISGQYSKDMKLKVNSITGNKDNAESDNCPWLLQYIKALTLLFDKKKNPFLSRMGALKGFLNCQQHPTQTMSKYLKEWKERVDTIEYRGGTFTVGEDLIPELNEDGRQRSKRERKAIARGSTPASTPIKGANPTRFGMLITGLANLCTRWAGTST